jgi:hypothetical protein
VDVASNRTVRADRLDINIIVGMSRGYLSAYHSVRWLDHGALIISKVQFCRIIIHCEPTKCNTCESYMEGKQ